MTDPDGVGRASSHLGRGVNEATGSGEENQSLNDPVLGSICYARWGTLKHWDGLVILEKS
jgi:hypothetical protein